MDVLSPRERSHITSTRFRRDPSYPNPFIILFSFFFARDRFSLAPHAPRPCRRVFTTLLFQTVVVVVGRFHPPWLGGIRFVIPRNPEIRLRLNPGRSEEKERIPRGGEDRALDRQRKK